MTAISKRLREAVAERSENYCEYCGLSQLRQAATFHVDHVKPRSRGGSTTIENLALACVSCSLRKGDRVDGIDPQTNKRVALFSPRRDSWRQHFSWDGVKILGKTPTGRATVAVLSLNRPLIIAIREEEFLCGRYPPPWHDSL